MSKNCGHALLDAVYHPECPGCVQAVEFTKAGLHPVNGTKIDMYSDDPYSKNSNHNHPDECKECAAERRHEALINVLLGIDQTLTIIRTEMQHSALSDIKEKLDSIIGNTR